MRLARSQLCDSPFPECSPNRGMVNPAFLLRASNDDEVGPVTSWVFSHNRNLQGNPIKSGSASVTETVHSSHLYFIPMVSNKFLSKVPLTRHVSTYQFLKCFLVYLVPGIGFLHRNRVSSQESLPNFLFK